MTGSWWRWVRPLGGAAILAVLVVGLGAGPVLDALRATDAGALAVGAAVAAVTTACAAWRWRLVARRLGVELSMPSAVAGCYRAQFLNVTLPGGVLGDVGRGGEPRPRGGRRGTRPPGRRLGAHLRTGRPRRDDRGGAPRGPPVRLAADARRPGVGARRGHGAVPWRRARGAPWRSCGSGGGSGAWPPATSGRSLAPAASVGIVVASLAVVAGHVATFVARRADGRGPARGRRARPRRAARAARGGGPAEPRGLGPPRGGRRVGVRRRGTRRGPGTRRRGRLRDDRPRRDPARGRPAARGPVDAVAVADAVGHAPARPLGHPGRRATSLGGAAHG